MLEVTAEIADLFKLGMRGLASGVSLVTSGVDVKLAEETDMSLIYYDFRQGVSSYKAPSA